MQLTAEQIDQLTKQFKEALLQGEDSFTCQWYEPYGVTEGLISTVRVFIRKKETEFI